MKKYNLAKILGITFLVGILLTWIIPTGQFREGEFYLLATNPLGILDLFRTPLNTLANFVHYGIIFLSIGGLYGVLNKTGVYSTIIDKIVKKYENKKERFLIISMLVFILLSSLVGINLLFFVLVPFFTTVILLLGYSKITALVATVGSMLVGGLGATYSNNINTTLRYFFNVSVHNEMFTRVIFLIIISVLFVMFVTKQTKEQTDNSGKKVNPNKIPLYTKSEQKDRNSLPLIIVSAAALLFLMIAMFDWQYSFGINFFREMHESILELKINGYPIVSNLIGAVNSIGNWTIYDIPIALTLLSLVIAWIYSLSLKDTVNSFVNGVKEMLPVAFYVTMANILFALIYFGQAGTDIFNAIANFLLTLGDKIQLITMSLTSIIGSVVYNDFIQFSSISSNIVTTLFDNPLLYPKFALILQFMYGLTMFVAPTSVLLVAGLSYFDVSYKEWLKYIWKYVLRVLIIVLLILAIIMFFI